MVILIITTMPMMTMVRYERERGTGETRTRSPFPTVLTGSRSSWSDIIRYNEDQI